MKMRTHVLRLLLLLLCLLLAAGPALAMCNYCGQSGCWGTCPAARAARARQNTNPGDSGGDEVQAKPNITRKKMAGHWLEDPEAYVYSIQLDYVTLPGGALLGGDSSLVPFSQSVEITPAEGKTLVLGYSAVTWDPVRAYMDAATCLWLTDRDFQTLRVQGGLDGASLAIDLPTLKKTFALSQHEDALNLIVMLRLLAHDAGVGADGPGADSVLLDDLTDAQKQVLWKAAGAVYGPNMRYDEKTLQRTLDDANGMLRVQYGLEAPSAGVTAPDFQEGSSTAEGAQSDPTYWLEGRAKLAGALAVLRDGDGTGAVADTLSQYRLIDRHHPRKDQAVLAAVIPVDDPAFSTANVLLLDGYAGLPEAVAKAARQEVGRFLSNPSFYQGKNYGYAPGSMQGESGDGTVQQDFQVVHHLEIDIKLRSTPDTKSFLSRMELRDDATLYIEEGQLQAALQALPGVDAAGRPPRASDLLLLWQDDADTAGAGDVAASGTTPAQ